jgi:hypothetical protein
LGAIVATLSETETSFAPLLYFPSRLSGLVDFFGELYSENPGRAQIMPDGRAFKTNPWFAFAATITSVHIGVLVGHGIVLLG